jgi:hypothetical protein
MTIVMKVVLASNGLCRTASTGALTDETHDPSGAVVPDVVLHLLNLETGETQSATSDREGRFSFPLLSPGSYEIQATKTGFNLRSSTGIDIP